MRSRVGVVFYDMITLYSEAADEADLCRTGFSKVRKQMNPQIYIGLLVGLSGFPIGYDIFGAASMRDIPCYQLFKNMKNVRPELARYY